MLPIPDESFSEKSYIQRVSRYGTQYSEKGTVKDGWITARIRSFGEFSVQIDTIAPYIKNRNFVNNGRVSGKRLIWNISEKESGLDRKSTRLNSSHVRISYAVFCLKKKKKKI